MRWILCTLLAALGCGQSAAPAKGPTQQSPVANERPAQVEPPSVTSDKVGGLDSSSEVNQASLQAAFPGYVIKTATRSSEGEEHTVFELYRNDRLSLTVEPGSTGKVYRVAIVDSDVKSPAGVGVGASYGQLAQAVPNHECFRLVEERTNSVACYGKDAATIGYVLGGAAEGQKPGAVPPAAVLAKSTVTEILWLPESE